MTERVVSDEQDQREVLVEYGPDGKVVSARNERGEVVVGSESGTFLWWKAMMDVLKIKILPRKWIFWRPNARLKKTITIG